MKSEWKEFLLNKGAELSDDDSVQSYGNEERELRMVATGDVIADLSHVGLIAAYGEDAATFLQGQFTADVRQVDEQHSQLSAYCSPKGRMLVSFRLFMRDGAYYLALPRPQLEATLKRLRMFVLRAKVTLEDASDSLLRIGFSGPKAQDQLSDYLGTAPSEVDAVVQAQGLTVIRIPGPHPRFEVHGELEAMKKLWTVLDVRGAPVGRGPWELLDIRAAVPVIHESTSDAFVPQMTNLQLLGGVNFKKGCYTGQEVVARMQYLGKLKRRMYRARVDAAHCPQPGDALYAPDSKGQSAGKVVTAQRSPDGGFELLAVVEIASLDAGPVHLGNDTGPVLEFLDLPYEFPDIASGDQA